MAGHVTNLATKFEDPTAYAYVRVCDSNIAATGILYWTRSSAIAEGPRDASCQLKITHSHVSARVL